MSADVWYRRFPPDGQEAVGPSRGRSGRRSASAFLAGADVKRVRILRHPPRPGRSQPFFLPCSVGLLRRGAHRRGHLAPEFVSRDVAVALFLSSTVAPEWFPFQAPRLLAILIFLLTVPAGHALAAVSEN